MQHSFHFEFIIVIALWAGNFPIVNCLITSAHARTEQFAVIEGKKEAATTNDGRMKQCFNFVQSQQKTNGCETKAFWPRSDNRNPELLVRFCLALQIRRIGGERKWAEFEN